ncbi:MAG: LamG domain-containing protein [Proteobacteria bacterium]|nr:LamG domain-containing protein [Pseudomonadota bacterium]
MTSRDSEQHICNEGGSILLHLVVVMIIVGLIGVAMVSLMSTSLVQQVFSDQSQQADLLSESGFRYLTTRYKTAPNEIAKNISLKNIHGQTYILTGNDGRFDLTVAPYFYMVRSDHPAGATRLSGEFPGVKPDSFSIPTSGILGVLSGTRYTLYSYSALSGNDQAFQFQNIIDTSDLSPGLNTALATGRTVNPVLTCETRVLSSGTGNRLRVTGATSIMPSADGVFDIITHGGEFKDSNGTRTGIYVYKTRVGDILYDISVYKNPAAVFSLSLTPATRIAVHRSALIESTGTVNAGTELETNRRFSAMTALGDTVVTVSATDLIYDNPNNVLVDLIDGADVLGDSDTVTPGKVGAAMSFDGDMDYIRLADDPTLDLTSAGSIGAWIKVTAFDNNFAGIIRKGGLANDSDLAYSLEFRAGRRLRLTIHSTTSSLSLDSSATLTAGIWYHVAGTWGPAGMFIYIDGQEDNHRPDTLVVRNTTGTVQIGAQLDELFNPAQKNYGFHGILDEVFIYATQEDLCGIRDIFSNPCNTGCDALAYYPFNGNFQDNAGEDKLGDRAKDASGTGPSLSSDRFACSNQAVQFQWWQILEIGSESPFDFTGSFTVSAWVQVGAWSWLLGDDSFVAKGTDSFRLQRYNNTNNGNFGTTGFSRVDTRGSDNLNDGNWHHLVGVYDGSRKTLYVDGVRDAFDNVSGNLHLNNSRVRMGTLSFLSIYTFQIDDVGFWDRDLSSDEVTHIFNGLRTDPSLP